MDWSRPRHDRTTKASIVKQCTWIKQPRRGHPETALLFGWVGWNIWMHESTKDRRLTHKTGKLIAWGLPLSNYYNLCRVSKTASVQSGILSAILLNNPACYDGGLLRFTLCYFCWTPGPRQNNINRSSNSNASILRALSFIPKHEVRQGSNYEPFKNMSKIMQVNC